MMKRIVLAALACAAVTSAQAEPVRKIVGNWIVSSEEDRFGEGGTYVAMTLDDTANAFGVRCIERQLTLALMPGTATDEPLEKGQQFSIKLRTDKGPVQDLKGGAINARLIQMEATPELVRMVRGGKETALRYETERGTSRTLVFTTRDNAKAFARVASECKVD